MTSLLQYLGRHHPTGISWRARAVDITIVLRAAATSAIWQRTPVRIQSNHHPAFAVSSAQRLALYLHHALNHYGAAGLCSTGTNQNPP